MMHEVKMTVKTEVTLPQVCFRFNTTNKSGTNQISKCKIKSVIKKKLDHKYTKTLEEKKPKTSVVVLISILSSGFDESKWN